MTVSLSKIKDVLVHQVAMTNYGRSMVVNRMAQSSRRISQRVPTKAHFAKYTKGVSLPFRRIMNAGKLV